MINLLSLADASLRNTEATLKSIEAFQSGGGWLETVYRFVLMTAFSILLIWLVVRMLKADSADSQDQPPPPPPPGSS